MGGGRRLARREHLHTEACDAGTPVAAVQQQVHGQEALAMAQDAEINISGCPWGGANRDGAGVQNQW